MSVLIIFGIIVLTLIFILLLKRAIRQDKINNSIKGVFKGKLSTIYFETEYEIDCVFEVLLIEEFDDNSLKVQIINKHNVSSKSQRLSKYFIEKFNEKYSLYSTIIVSNDDVAWVNKVNDQNVFELSPENLSKLVKTGKLELKDINLSLGDNWDYKKALEIVIESTK